MCLFNHDCAYGYSNKSPSLVCRVVKVVSYTIIIMVTSIDGVASLGQRVFYKIGIAFRYSRAKVGNNCHGCRDIVGVNGL